MILLGLPVNPVKGLTELGPRPSTRLASGCQSSQFFPQSAELVRRCLVCSRWATHLNVGLVSALATGRDAHRILYFRLVDSITFV